MTRVLVVDDEPQICELVQGALALEGYDVVTAADGSRALEALYRHPPDLVILDVRMPCMDGWEVLRRIKAEPERRLSEVPVVMVTGRTDDLDRVRGGIEGALRYLTKPFDLSELRDAVRAVLAGEPEPVQRRQAQHAALEGLARIEKGEPIDARPARPRPRLTRFEPAPHPPAPVSRRRAATVDVSALSVRQAAVLLTVGRTSTVLDAADQLQVSRSNVYACLRRIARRLDVRSVPELVAMARDGSFDVG